MDPAAADAGARRKAEQWMRVAEKLLVAKDLEGCKEFSAQALAADKGTPGAEDLHAAADVLLAAQRRRMPNGKPDPYAVLGIDPASPASRHPDVVHSSYRRLSLLLNQSHPDRPCSASLAEAARIVADAWAFLSNPGLKSSLDTELEAAAPLRAYRAPTPMQQPQPPLRPQQSPIGAAPQPRPSPQQSPIPAARQPPPPPQPSPLRAAPQPPARAAAPLPLPRQSPMPAARQPPPPPQPSPIPAALQPPARAAAPPPLQRQSPKWAAPQPRPPPQQSPIPEVHQPPPPPPPQQSSIPAAHQPPPPTQLSPPRAAVQPPSQAAATPVESGTSPSSTFWTICKTCSHIHQYDRLYETRKLKCSSCHQPFVAEAMTETPPIVPGTDMYYCTWGFFPVGFPGCPGFESLVNKQPQGQDQLNANGGVEANGGSSVQNGTPDGAPVESPVVLEAEPLMRMRVQVPAVPEHVLPTRVEVPAVPESVMPTRVEVPTGPKPVKTMTLNSLNVGAKKRGRPKGSKNKKKKV